MSLVLPKKFVNILEGTKYHGEILTVLEKFTDWIKDNRLEFFPEYTDHGIDHIQSVLNTSEQIITEKSWEILTPEDIYVLISAILLHDCAMHIDKNGLWALITHDKFNGATLGKFEKISWEIKWNEFKIKIKRFEENDWINFFGKFETVVLPEIDEINIMDYQKIIIGDFIRQYHGDIAEIIATYGIPCKSDNDNNSYEIFNSNFTSLNQLAGFIAKSHNYHLREMVDQLGGEQTARNYCSVHSAYLMAVLRIADYLQFTNARTPKILFKIRGTGMCSPVSLKEWKTHLSILHSHYEHSDNELLFVDAQPEEAHILEKMQILFSNIQYELDSCWAVIGEIYSRYSYLSNFGLTIRRIRSNIDNPQEYIKMNHKKFYPEILKIKSDNEKILPLLVAPLYGDFPQIGIRELLQNSIDACNERYSSEIKSNITNENIPYKVEIKINLDNNTLVIEDNGIGMDIDVIKNYFLKIGASYRYSEVWKATHSDENSTYVPRTGKFGIGMLAGFLIGNEIEVVTKKATMQNSEAIQFTYNLNQQKIQVNFIFYEGIGTRIVIKSDKEKLKTIVRNLHNDHYAPELRSFWYYLDTPQVNITVIENKETKIIENNYLIKKKDISEIWNPVKNSTLQGFYWRLEERSSYYHYHEKLYCNGIAIRAKQRDIFPIIKIDFGWEKLRLEIHDICIFDNLGQFPLNLTRDNLISSQFFEIEKLRNSVLEFFYLKLKNLLTNFTYSDNVILQLIMLCKNTQHSPLLPFVLFKNKILPFGHQDMIGKKILFDFTYDSQKRGIIYNTAFQLINDFGYTCIYDSKKEVDTIRYAIEYFFFNEAVENTRFYASLNNSYMREKMKKLPLTFEGFIYIKTYDLNKLDTNEIHFLEQNNITITSINVHWSVLVKTKNISSIPKIGEAIIANKSLNSFLFVIGEITSIDKTEFSELWEQYGLNK